MVGNGTETRRGFGNFTLVEPKNDADMPGALAVGIADGQP
jgi:hypothetical protein